MRQSQKSKRMESITQCNDKIRQRWMTNLQKKTDDKPSTPFCRMRFWIETITINVTGNVFQRYDCTQVVALTIFMYFALISYAKVVHYCSFFFYHISRSVSWLKPFGVEKHYFSMNFHRIEKKKSFFSVKIHLVIVFDDIVEIVMVYSFYLMKK